MLFYNELYEININIFLKKRVRTENWSCEEKDFLRELVELHLNVIENRGNDTKLVEKKYSMERCRRENDFLRILSK